VSPEAPAPALYRVCPRPLQCTRLRDHSWGRGTRSPQGQVAPAGFKAPGGWERWAVLPGKLLGTRWARDPGRGPTCGQQGVRLQTPTPPHPASRLAGQASCPSTRWSQNPLPGLPLWAQRNSGARDRRQPPGVVFCQAPTHGKPKLRHAGNILPWTGCLGFPASPHRWRSVNARTGFFL